MHTCKWCVAQKHINLHIYRYIIYNEKTRLWPYFAEIEKKYIESNKILFKKFKKLNPNVLNRGHSITYE